MAMADWLRIEGLRAGYGEAVVLPELSLQLAEGEVLALLGRNGTGKTTLINSIVGVTRRFSGTLGLGGLDLTGLRPDQRARAGIGPGLLRVSVGIEDTVDLLADLNAALKRADRSAAA